MVPIGSRLIEVPIAEVDSMDVKRVVLHPIRLLAGAGLVIVPWFFLPWWGSLPLLILGLWTILIALGPHLEVVTKTGKVQRSPICFGHSLDAELYKAAVEDMISGEPSF